MIGYLRGQVIDRDGEAVIVEVGGVGYKVRVAANKKFRFGADEVELYVHTYVKEDEISLYGFADKQSLRMFELLVGVSGVGPKMAMSVLARGDGEQIARAVAMADVDFFKSVSGIGKKNAQRIIVDLKSKLGDLEELDLSETEMADEVVEALVGMGYAKRQVVEVLRELEAGLSDEERIKGALKRLGRKK